MENRALEPGPAYDPSRHDPLLIPTTGNAVPDWSLEFFRRVLDRASEGVVVLQFHGVPDVAHDWVHTPPERFRKYMEELGRQGFSVLALRDLGSPPEPTNDPNVNVRNGPVRRCCAGTARRAGGNPRCPCLHADPVFPDCAPGQTVRLKGRLWFHEGSSVEDEIAAASRRFKALSSAEPDRS